MENTIMYLKLPDTTVTHSLYVDKLDEVADRYGLEIFKMCDTLTSVYLAVGKYKCSTVLIYDLSELGNSLCEILLTIDKLKENGIKNVCTAEKFYMLENFHDVFNLNILAATIECISHYRDEYIEDETLEMDLENLSAIA